MITDSLIHAAKEMRAADLPDTEILDTLRELIDGSNGRKVAVAGMILRGLEDPTLGIDPMAAFHANLGKPRSAPTFDLVGKQTNVVIADLHIPLHRKDILMDVSRRHEGDRLIIAGDILNNTSASKYIPVVTALTRFKEHMITDSNVNEMTVELFIELSKYWKEIVVVRGNHDFRKAKNKAKNSNGDGTDTEDYLISQLHTYVKSIVIPNERGVDYYAVKIGDLWAGHWAWYGAAPAHGVRKVVTDFLPRPQIKAMGECRVVVHGHTHKVAECLHQYVWAIECGAMCHTPDYVDEGFGKSGDPQLGYAVIVQEDGHLIQRESHTVKYGLNDYLYTLDGKEIYNS